MLNTHEVVRICAATKAGRFGVFHIQNDESGVTVNWLMADGVTNDAPVALTLRVRRCRYE